MGSRLGHASIGVEPPPGTSGMFWDDEQEPTMNYKVGVGFEEVPIGDRYPTCAVELSPADFSADPSILFSGVFSTGFTGIDDQGITGEATTYITFP